MRERRPVPEAPKQFEDVRDVLLSLIDDYWSQEGWLERF